MKLVIKGMAAIALLLGDVTAYEKKDAIVNELHAISSMVDAMENPDMDKIVSTIEQRQQELTGLVDSHPEFNERYASELNSLGLMVDAIEEDNLDNIMKEVEARKGKLLMDLTFSLTDAKNVPKEHTEVMADDKDKKAKDETKANTAFDNYKHALKVYFNQLPDDNGAQRYVRMKQTLIALNLAAESFNIANKEQLKLYDYTSFNAYYAKQEAANQKYEEDEKKEAGSGTKVVAWKELKELKEAGEKFDRIISENIGYFIHSRYSKVHQYYPYTKQETDSQTGWSKYVDQVKAWKVDVYEKKFHDALSAVNDAKKQVVLFVNKGENIVYKKNSDGDYEEDKDGRKIPQENCRGNIVYEKYDHVELFNFFNDCDYGELYVNAVMKIGKLPNKEEIAKKLAANPKSKPLIQAKKLIDQIPEEHVTEYNKRLATEITAGQTWAGAAAEFDEAITQLQFKIKASKEWKDDDDNYQDKIKPAMKFAYEPIEHRQKVMAIYKAGVLMNEANAKAQDAMFTFQNEGKPPKPDLPDIKPVGPGGKDNKEKDEGKEKKSNGAAIGIGVAAAVIAVGGVVYCKCAKKCCFADKDAEEGGERTDRSIFKKEIKSKKAHKRHTKESLVPVFQVAEEQA